MKSSDTNNLFSIGNGGIFAAIVIIVAGLFVGLGQVNRFPAYTHAWSQSDWYSIAIGFLNNGFDFFHPETLIYNKQYPGWWKVAEATTITSVDFPLHEYIVALLMKMVGTQAPWVFRSWTLLCSLAGLWFLYLLSYRLTLSHIKSAAVVAMALFSPLYSYYFAGFLPSAPALALVVVGLWAYVVFLQEGRPSYWHWAVAMLALATLTRTSHAVVLVAVFCYEILRLLRIHTISQIFRFSDIKILRISEATSPAAKASGNSCNSCSISPAATPLASPWGRWISPVVAVVSIVGYILWNNHLRAVNGSMFLNTLRAPGNWGEVKEILDFMKLNWRYVYFSKIQQYLLLAVMAGAMAMLFIRRGRRKRGTLSLWWFVAIWFFGEMCFFAAMMVQFYDHDYYFLDSFFMPVIFMFAIALRGLPAISKRWVGIVSVLLLVLAVTNMYGASQKEFRSRCDSNDTAYLCSLNYAGSDLWLDSIGVSRDARILSVFSYPQNSPFILMGRKGYSLMWYDEDIIESAMEFPFDYVVIEDDSFRRNFPWYEVILGRLTRISGNGRLSLCRMEDTVVNRSVDDFFGRTR